MPPPIPTPPIPVIYYADAGYDAARMLADRIFLYDPAIVGTITGGISYVGVDYVSWPAYTADKRATMVFNDQCQVAGDPDGEVRPIWSRIATA